ncbi:MAG: ABC-type antimicrobial peptide transport system, permease component [uncultured Phycisphaerae bacterium]|uniref:ABC-type antimicrobial peptide transport system, permease component n=1 Tax=uncultured Phycisphaerae bacterium TaxID=904963 RepID=A0A6J4Q4C2_9BACT|nr:MAG: ABC-type antimicrobial peptide transport system, permease component [uncultured Phycisphaerae bacterium]
MRIIRTLRTAVRALRRNIMRSVLTTLGIIIGIAAVIAMMEIGNGVSKQIQQSLSTLGANNLMVFPGSGWGGGANQGSRVTLTVQDAEAILERCPAVLNAAPVVNANGQVIAGGNNYPAGGIMGTTPAYLEVRGLPVEEGEPFTDRDVVASAQVCLIGKTLVRELFGGVSPVGKEVRINNVSLRVIGVLAAKGANMWGRDQDDVIIAPWTTVKYRISSGGGAEGAAASGGGSGGGTSDTVNSLNNRYPANTTEIYPSASAIQQANTPVPVRFANVNQIVCAATSSQTTAVALEQINELLRERHRIRPGDEDDFTVRDMTELGNAMSSTTMLMTTLLLIVAGISLVVGGVGIMNIMLVSVTERTREIGLRMAVGARGHDILIQFLVEATLLCLIGGAIGILLGRGTSIAVRMTLNWATAVSLPAIIISVAVSMFVGLIFGFYPAWKASRLDPIEALRYE